MVASGPYADGTDCTFELDYKVVTATTAIVDTERDREIDQDRRVLEGEPEEECAKKQQIDW